MASGRGLGNDFDPQPGEGHSRLTGSLQIKHMGYRIELEEIEAALHCLSYVSEAVVLHGHVNGLSRLIAIVAGTEFGTGRIRATRWCVL